MIEIHALPYKWLVSRRYKQFAEVHEKLVEKHSLDKNLLPPKKLFGNRSESFIIERQKALELYLQTLISLYSLPPEPLGVFLDFPKYEVRGITSALSETLFCQGDEIITKEAPYTFSLVQLHAIHERLKLSEPTCYGNNPKQDIAHLVEFITQLKHLKVVGSNECFKDSNIIPNELSFDLSFFKFLETLRVTNCNLKRMISVDAIRKHLKSVGVHKSLNDLSSFLLCGTVHWSPVSDPVQNWPLWECLTYANFSQNALTRIDPSVKLLSAIQHLDLSFNKIQTIENLETLSELTVLVLSHNDICDLNSMHTRLGNIYTLSLSSNKIKQLHGLSKLFSVTELQLQSNFISSFVEVEHLTKLPCLEILNLQNNPLTFNVDYRPQLLLLFGSRAAEIEFDHLKPSDKEMDTVSVLQALRQARGEHGSLANHDNAIQEVSCVSAKKVNSKSFGKIDSSDEGIVSGSRKFLNLNEASKFRQRVEDLRKIGGSDWLRLLNDMHFSRLVDASKPVSVNGTEYPTDVADVQLHTMFDLDKTTGSLSLQNIESLTISAELSYPEWLLALDSSDVALRQQLIAALCKEGTCLQGVDDGSHEKLYGMFSDLISEAQIVWAAHLMCQESSVYEIPMCILLLESKLILLKVRCFSKNSNFSSLRQVPEFTYHQTISTLHILLMAVGPCNTYVDFKLKISCGTENLTFLMTNEEAMQEFISHCQRLYNIVPTQKPNPFANKTLIFDNIHSGLPLANISMQNQIIFGQRVLISKVLHKSHYGILHYVFVTPSHVVLVEERLHIPHIIGLDITAQPQFHICALVSVHTNIKQIHLKDVDPDVEKEHESPTNETMVKPEALPENKHLEILYKSGSWLIVEFDSGVLLHLKFSNLKQRNAFMDAFLCARSQR